MTTLCLALALAGCLPARANSAQEPDPVLTDGDKYSVLLENEYVRVLDYRDAPGDKTHLHHHPAFALYALTPFRRKLSLPDGKELVREFKAGEIAWMPAQTHAGENIGGAPTRALIFELKER